MAQASLTSPPDDAASLSRSAAAGARWGIVSNLVQQVGRLAFTLLLARLVGPEDFGVVALAAIYIGFVQLFLDQGFGAALIQKRDVDRVDMGSVMWLNLASAVLLAGLTLVVAPFVAEFFETPALTDVLRVLSLSLLISGVSAVPLAMMNRRLRFRAMATVDVVAVVTGGLAGVGHALAGGGYWALVTQTLVSAVITMIGLLIINGPPPLHLSLGRLRAMLGFSAGLFGARIVQYCGSHGDSLLVGRFLGTADLAFYNLAFRMQQLPAQTLGRLVNQVAFPVYSRLQHDPNRIRSWFLLSTRTTAVISYPLLTVGILLVPYLVPLVLGQEWTPAVVPMQLFILGAFRSITLKQVGPVFMSFGRTRTTFRLSSIEVAAILTAVAIGLQWGVVGVAVGYLSARLLVAPLVLRAAAGLIDLKRGDYARSVAPVWAGCGILVALWFGCHAGLTALGVSEWVSVAAASMTGLLGYLLTLRFAFRGTWRDAAKVLGMVLRRRKPTREAVDAVLR